MAIRLRELNPDTAYEFVLTPTGDELPPMVKHWNKLESILGPLKRLPTITLMDLIEQKQMLPAFHARFCTEYIKVRPFIEYMRSLPKGSVMYVGLRADEQMRKGVRSPGVTSIYPMRDWGWGIEDVIKYLREKGVTIPKRTDCGCCYDQRLSEWKDLLDNYPDRYEKYVQLEKKMGHTFRSPKRDSWPAPLDELREEFRSGRKLRGSQFLIYLVWLWVLYLQPHTTVVCGY
jgi:hypothetical protein